MLVKTKKGVWMDGCMDGLVDEWMDGKAFLRIAYSNQKVFINVRLILFWGQQVDAGFLVTGSPWKMSQV